MKISGRAEVVEDDAKLTAQVTSSSYKARPERVITFTVKAWDVNCPKHIPRRYSEEQVQTLQDEINRLKEELLKQEA
jgi:uncharacterized protein